ncbi:cytochrome P450 [Streptomyces sp. SAI-090]|uniref:cytochrome P450 n=1 Tax=unclassified Streptomyces TaxID=2593676 RepID=UPI0024730BB7|nr:cytochrome P450 [Streptomyces sp. SAI-090]
MIGFPLGAAVTAAELAGDPHPCLAALRAHEPVSWLPELNGWLVTRRDLALDVMRDAETFTVDDPRFSTARIVGPSMLSLDGDAHSRHREPFTAPFRPRAVRDGFAAFIERESDRLVTALAPAGAAELRRAFAGPLAVAVVTEALGLVEADTDTVLSWYEAIVRSVSDLTEGRQAGTAGPEAYAQLRRAVEATVADGADSLLTSAAGRLALPEVASNAAVLMFGGIETTEAMITNALLHLLGHPDQLSLVRADFGLLDGAIEESLRLEPGAAVVDRYATRDLTLGPAAIRRGDLVTVSLTGANRDPEVFPDPDRFDVRRANARLQLAFAHGPHYCLAAHLARLETRIALRHLLDRLPALRLDPARPAAPRGLVFRKPPALHVLWG